MYFNRSYGEVSHLATLGPFGASAAPPLGSDSPGSAGAAGSALLSPTLLRTAVSWCPRRPRPRPCRLLSPCPLCPFPRRWLNALLRPTLRAQAGAGRASLCAGLLLPPFPPLSSLLPPQGLCLHAACTRTLGPSSRLLASPALRRPSQKWVSV